MTDDPVAAVVVGTPAGTLTFVAELLVEESRLWLKGVHIQDMSPNTIGSANMKVIARALMERMGYDELVVEGATRTTGANPGRRPKALRFSRTVRPASAFKP